MSSGIVYQGVPYSRETNDNDSDQTLFAGQKLWFSHVIPQRRWLIENARRNGAVIVDTDTDADVRLVDHAKKNNAPGTHSYKYVESSIRNGRLEDLTTHTVGAPSRVTRPIGSSVTSSKGGRTPFTPADDQFLWNWLKPFVDRGGSWKGNEIYKQLEEVNPRHTFQSWRDRWIKHTQYQKRQVTEIVEPNHHQQPEGPAAAPSAPAAQKKRRRELDDDGEAWRMKHGQEQRSERPLRTERSAAPKSPVTATPVRAIRERIPYQTSAGRQTRVDVATKTQPAVSKPFTEEEADMLYGLVATVRGMKLEEFDALWEVLAEQNDRHTAAGWKGHFVAKVLPDYCRRNGLAISKVTPFLSQEFQNGTAAVSGGLESQTGCRTGSVAASSQGELQCAICFIDEPSKWRQDKEGRVLCHDCYRLVKVHGFRRASMLRAGQEGEGGGKARDAEIMEEREGEEEQTSHISPEDNNVSTQTVPTCRHTTLSDEIVEASQSADQTSPQSRRRTRSPSFQPDSPPFTRLPESNTSRKRSAGRSTQSQSTQPSNPSNVNSQDSASGTHSQSQERASQAAVAAMGAEQSTESHPQSVGPQAGARGTSSIVAPAFRTSSRDTRKGLHNEPTLLPTQQHSSLSTDGRPSSQRTAHLVSTDTDKKSQKMPALTSPPIPTSPSGRSETQVRGTSWLFVSESEDDDNAEGDAEANGRLLRDAAGAQASPSTSVQLFSDKPGPNVHSSSEYDVDETDEDVEVDFADLVPPNKRQRSDEFETAQEIRENYETAQEEKAQQDKNQRGCREAPSDQLTSDEDIDLTELPDPEGGFEAYGVDASVMPPDDESNDAFDSTEHPASEGKDRDESPEIKIEDETWLRPRHGAMLPLEDSQYLSIPSAESLGEPVEWQEGAQRAEVHYVKQEDDNDEAQLQKERRIAVHCQETQQPEAEPQDARHKGAQSREAEHARQGRSSTTSVPDQAQPLPTPEHPMDKWFDEQRKSYPTTRACEQVLLKAAESTTFQWELASTIVPIMLSNRHAHATRLRRQRRGKELSTAELAMFDHDKFLPRDIQGVWTVEDDKDLCSKDGERQNRVLRKHGRSSCAARFEFLKDASD
ncbi:hypothetical protein A1O7_00515 [Cladophialophora yegresii CBS 114405]|uniref:Telomeric repeat-binding factor 2-interacting protein 1 n=1 Tax=Cladophialophora yegresii CBS 114405 TaxID=1182544 RepID=W9X101_9EURO|nr:uncharacterized protein A1O7_00515 [Cladophialophora yegresii CBS 114405]EXJ64179.1 hypothetical protein A1O7_00515 [Cladophialophora yegresii CBS 114405]